MQVERQEGASVNDHWCIRYQIIMPMEDILVEEEKRGDSNWSYTYRYPAKSEENKYINLIKKEIPEDETILEDFGGAYINGLKHAVFTVYTKKTNILKRENEIKKILRDNTYSISYSDEIQLNEKGYVKINIPMEFDKETIEEIYNLIGATDYYIDFTDTCGMYMVYKI